MKEIPDNSIDLVLSDPPYGTTNCKWDSPIDLGKLWKELKRISKGNVIMTACQPYTTTLISSNMDMFKYCMVWDKHIPRGFQVAKYRPMTKHEDVVIFGNGKCTYNPQMVERDKPVKVKNYSKRESTNDIGKYNDPTRQFVYTHRNPDTIIVGCWEANSGKIHPAQKPVSLMQYLIKTFSNPNETVLDFSMGSGSTAIACIETGRKFIGIELDSKTYKDACHRIRTHTTEIRND